MGIIVQKFGGSSVASTEKLYKVCNHIIKEYDKGNQVVVVVSAQGKTTDKLFIEESEITKSPPKIEHDMLLATGEQITISKLSMCLKELGYKSRAFMGWQIPIITDCNYGNSRIKRIDDTKILKNLELGNIVIVAGFQGVDIDGNITTFGRGGSDTTAVALAATLKAERCDIFTDVNGIYIADPRIIQNAKKIESITYDEMLELASLGAKVLHNRCVEIGKNFNIPIIVKSTFEDESNGTIVKYQKELEGLYISGIAKMDNISRVTLLGIDSKIGETYKLFKMLSENSINVDIIVQSFGENTLKDISFSINSSELEKTIQLLKNSKDEIKLKEILYCDNLSKISIVGLGIANIPGVATKMFEALYENNVNMHMISTSEIKISVLVDESKAEISMKAIYNKFLEK